MHYTTLALHLFTFINLAHPFPIYSRSGTSSDHSDHSTPILRVRQVVPPAVIPTPVPNSSTGLPSSLSPSSTSTTPPTSTADSSRSRKYVVAHHMVGNTYPYTLKDWADDIALAHNSGIDGFALNIGREVWEPARVSDAYVLIVTYMIDQSERDDERYAAALQSGLDFKLFLSLDMSCVLHHHFCPTDLHHRT